MGTMFTLAKKIGNVEEIAYDPKVSQTTDYTRAKVTMNVENPAFEAKNLYLPSGEIIVITYEYEKIHKRCFTCFRLTHEKSRCPSRKGSNNSQPRASLCLYMLNLKRIFHLLGAQRVMAPKDLQVSLLCFPSYQRKSNEWKSNMYLMLMRQRKTQGYRMFASLL